MPQSDQKAITLTTSQLRSMRDRAISRQRTTRFVLGQASSEDTLGTINEREIFGKKHGLWWIRFYGHLLDFDSGILTSAEFAELMRTLADTSQPLFSDQDYFLTVLWSEEFLIARQLGKNVVNWR